jgi:hypothetical protein
MFHFAAGRLGSCPRWFQKPTRVLLTKMSALGGWQADLLNRGHAVLSRRSTCAESEGLRSCEKVFIMTVMERLKGSSAPPSPSPDTSFFGPATSRHSLVLTAISTAAACAENAPEAACDKLSPTSTTTPLSKARVDIQHLTEQAMRAERLAKSVLDKMASDGLMALASKYRERASARSELSPVPDYPRPCGFSGQP